MSEENGSKKTPKEMADELAVKRAEQSRLEKELREKQRLEKKFTRYTLLVAEDDVDLQEALVQEAEDKGFKVVRAADGAEAVRKAMTQQFDAILIDMNLPKKMGNEAVVDIRQSGPSKDAVIVALSGYLKKEVVQTLVGKIEKAFTKPADIEMVIDTLLDLAEKKIPKKTGS